MLSLLEIMTRGAHACSEDDSANRAAQLMWDHDIGCVPIVNRTGRLIGIVTDRDICMAASTQGRRLNEIPAIDAGTREVVAAREDDNIQSVEDLMRRHQIRRLPVVDGSGRLVGMVSLNDLARKTGRGLDASGVAGTLASISEHTHRVAA
ncbi:MAG: CBS domain-containing protein [Polyangiaceae bacterium]|nr:CBS domain-containing protein [Polyangiaceae bacterium]